MSAHESTWTLRRLHVGELPALEAARIREHAETCEACGAQLRSFSATQAAFEAEVPFERFEAGVERAVERQAAGSETEPVTGQRGWLPLRAVAASVFVLVLALPLLYRDGLGPGGLR